MSEPLNQQHESIDWKAGENQYSSLAQGAIHYISPSEQSPDDFPQHKFELQQNGEVIAGVEVDYFSKPLPLYQLTGLWSEDPGKGNASKVMEAVEGFLEERRKPGVLVEAIIEDDPGYGMYKRRGWLPVPDSLGLHVYNWPTDVSLDVLKGYASRITPLQDREAWQDSIE